MLEAIGGYGNALHGDRAQRLDGMDVELLLWLVCLLLGQSRGWMDGLACAIFMAMVGRCAVGWMGGWGEGEEDGDGEEEEEKEKEKEEEGEEDGDGDGERETGLAIYTEGPQPRPLIRPRDGYY